MEKIKNIHGVKSTARDSLLKVLKMWEMFINKNKNKN